MRTDERLYGVSTGTQLMHVTEPGLDFHIGHSYVCACDNSWIDLGQPGQATPVRAIMCTTDDSKWAK